MSDAIRKSELGEGLSTRYVSLRKRRRGQTRMQPPLTPMIDVTFQLLIYFLLTATFREAEGQIPGSLPNTSGVTAGQKVEFEPTKVHLVPRGVSNELVEYRIEGGEASSDPQKLYEDLRIRKEQLDAPLVIQVNKEVRWEFVVEAFNQAIRAEYEDIGFGAP
jgi:biopolymer transport protein ExbD